ncbi:MAG TPA: class I SAM-dependent methyltransferase [Candidatus Limnocylindria bacterium]|nr:class I SAM-dependent methyltransferase [Candidatus Limnocylindria bacterium]
MTSEAAEPNAVASRALARLYDLDLAEEPGDVELYQALARRTGGPVIELAVGSGRLAIPLARDGHEVVGVDLDPAMLERGREHARAADDGAEGRLTLVEGDLTDAATLPDVARRGPYGLAFIGLNSILLLASAERQRAAIRALASVLRPGGVAIIDAWQPTPADLVAFDGRLSLEWLRRDPETGNDVTKTAAAWFDSAARHVTLTTIFEEGQPGGPVVRWTRVDALRLVTADELTSWAEAAGLEVEQLAGDHDLSALAPGSERAILVARKPATG